MLKVDEINLDAPENARNKILFENLTPLFPDQRLRWNQAMVLPKILPAELLTWFRL